MLTTVEKVLALRNVELFNEVPGEVLAEMGPILEEVFFEKGRYIVRQGEIGRELYTIIKGSVEVLSDGKVLDTIKDGGCFGEMSIIDSSPTSADVTAVKDSTLLKIEKDDFYGILRQHDKVAIGIIKVLNKRIRNLNKRLVEISSQKSFSN